MNRLNFDLGKISMEISFHFQTPVTLKHRHKLRAFLEGIFKAEGKKYQVLDIIFCSDAYLLAINRQFLQHDNFTDIITFDLSDDNIRRGEIYISVDRVRDNARAFAVTMNAELHRVLFHGVCHLCGYKDKTPKDKKLMRAKEDFYLSLYFVPRGTSK